MGAHSQAETSFITGPKAWKWYISFFRDQIGTLTKMRRRFGPAVALQEYLPGRRRQRKCLVLAHEEFNRQVLSDPDSFQSSGVAIRGRSGTALNRLHRGLVGMNGEEHRLQRRLATPLFAPKAIARYYPRMVEIVHRQLETWPLEKEFDANSYVSRMSLNVSANNLLGSNVDDAALLGQLCEQQMRLGTAPGAAMIPLDLPGTPFRKLLRHSEKTAFLVGQMVDRRKANEPEVPDMMDRLVQVHRLDPHSMSREMIIEQIVVSFSASHETVAKAVTWTLFLLSQHPQIMAELHQELQQTLRGEPPSLDELQRLPLLDAVTKETMRLFPPIPWVPRKIRTETEIAGVEVKHRDYLVLNHYMTHRSPDVYAEPLQFRPERWFDIKPSSFAYLPFSAGPRTCIGKALGTVVINLMVAMILQRLRLSAIPHRRIDRAVHITLAPKYGLPMIAHEQNGRFAAFPVRGNVHQMVDLTRQDASTRPPTIHFATVGESHGLRRAA